MKKQTYRTPTSEDAKKRPVCEVRNNENSEWREATLISVLIGAQCPFYVRLSSEVSDCYIYCQMIDGVVL